MTPPVTDTSEKGLETIIFNTLVGGVSPEPPSGASTGQVAPPAYGAGYLPGDPKDYDREFAVDLAHLRTFLQETQEATALPLELDHPGATRQKFLARLQGEISKRGVIDVLRHGIKHGPHHLDLFYGTPSPGNPKAAGLFAANRFSVTRQLQYSRDETQRALDLAIFINGLPVATLGIAAVAWVYSSLKSIPKMGIFR